MQILTSKFNEEPVWVVKYNTYMAPSKRKKRKLAAETNKNTKPL